MAAECIFKIIRKEKKMKRIVNILALVLLLCTVFSMMVSCENENNENNNNEPEYKDYSVTVVDGVGTPISGIVVEFTTPSGEVKKRVTDDNGVAKLPNSIEGIYQVKLDRALSTALLTKTEYTLTEDVNSIKILAYDEEKAFEIYGEIPDKTLAQSTGVGSFDLPYEANSTYYMVFYAREKGVYKVSLASDSGEMTVGFYGIPMFVQSTHRGEGEYDGKSFELIIQDPETPYVIGITTTKAEEAHLTIERTGDAPFDPQYEPWTEVTAKGEIGKCTLPVGTVLTDVDVTDPTFNYELRDDGYYYTTDGKLIYLRIGSVRADKQYLDASIAYIAGLVDQNFGQNFGGYVYDENGEFVGKYSFNTMLASYYEQSDGSGVYPLTAELAEAIKIHGNSCGWFKFGTANYLFDGVPVVSDNAWLFLCCTAN